MKHVARRHYYAKEMQADGEVAVTWIETKLNLADAMTKALPLPHFQKLTAGMRRLQVLGGRAVSAMRAAIGGSQGLAPCGVEAGDAA